MHPVRPLALAYFLACPLVAPAEAHEYRAGEMLVVHPWMAATDATATSVAAFLTLKNQGAAPDRLLSVYLPEAASFRFASTATGEPAAEGQTAGALEVVPGGKVKLKPGTGYVLLGMKGPLAEGRMLTGTLTFEKAGKVEVGFYVQDASSSAATCAANPDGE